jgi:hypothetical protein
MKSAAVQDYGRAYWLSATGSRLVSVSNGVTCCRKAVQTKSALLVFALSLALICLVSSQAYGDVGVVLNESLGTSVERVTGSGHTAVYFSRICPDSPVKLRLCRPGEYGSVMSNYINLGEDERYEWNIAPLSAYVYGVKDPRNRPLFGSPKVKGILEARYRDGVLPDYCSTESCETSDKAEWREMVGASLSRSMYIFVVATTVQQDLDLIAKFNALPNENHFNGFTRNCADFTKDVVNTYFPHSAHRDPINDFAMTSPKAIARTFTHYALSHPEMNFRVLHFSQLPGTIKRSTVARSGTEQLYRSKKLLIPMVVFASHELPAAAAAYMLTGRYDPEREFEEHPISSSAQVDNQIRLAKSEDDGARVEELESVETQEREKIVGTDEEWKEYRREYDLLVNDAVAQEIIPNRIYLSNFFKHMDEAGMPYADAKGALWMDVREDGNLSRKIGVGLSSIFAPGSDPGLGYKLFLARVGQVLKSPKHSRETMLEFRDDWALLQYARVRATTGATGVPPRVSPDLLQVTRASD